VPLLGFFTVKYTEMVKFTVDSSSFGLKSAAEEEDTWKLGSCTALIMILGSFALKTEKEENEHYDDNKRHKYCTHNARCKVVGSVWTSVLHSHCASVFLLY
jgi:hypothetical protein